MRISKTICCLVVLLCIVINAGNAGKVPFFGHNNPDDGSEHTGSNVGEFLKSNSAVFGLLLLGGNVVLLLCALYGWYQYKRKSGTLTTNKRIKYKHVKFDDSSDSESCV